MGKEQWQDEHHGEGGTFEIDKATGKRVRVGEAPKSHPDGDRARDKDGKPILEKQPQPASALPEPARSPYEPDQADQVKPAKGTKA